MRLVTPSSLPTKADTCSTSVLHRHQSRHPGRQRRRHSRRRLPQPRPLTQHQHQEEATRTFPHRPDVGYLTKDSQFTYDGIDELSAQIRKTAPVGWARMGRTALLTGWEAVALSWAEERPVADVRRYLNLTADWCSNRRRQP